MKLVSAASGSRFVSRLAFISCFFWFASTGNVREAPRVATRLERGGVDPFRRQVRKLGIDALKALASELGVSVEGIRWKEEFASRVNVQRSKCKNLLHGWAVSCKAVAQSFFGRSSRRWRLEIFVPLRKSVSSYLSYYIYIIYICKSLTINMGIYQRVSPIIRSVVSNFIFHQGFKGA